MAMFSPLVGCALLAAGLLTPAACVVLFLTMVVERIRIKRVANVLAGSVHYGEVHT